MKVKPKIKIGCPEYFSKKVLNTTSSGSKLSSNMYVWSFPNTDRPNIPAPRAEKVDLLEKIDFESIINIGKRDWPTTCEMILDKANVCNLAVSLSRYILLTCWPVVPLDVNTLKIFESEILFIWWFLKTETGIKGKSSIDLISLLTPKTLSTIVLYSTELWMWKLSNSLSKSVITACFDSLSKLYWVASKTLFSSISN